MDYKKLTEIPVDYDSPLMANFIEKASAEIAKAMDDNIYRTVFNAGFDIDKDKLVQALQQDYMRYSDAYKSGYSKGYEKREDEIVRCKDCKHGNPGACGDGIDCDGVWHDADWFCADGERRNDDA